MELLDHLIGTYSQQRDNLCHLEEVEKATINSGYNPKEPIEVYFVRLQEAHTQAVLLGQPYYSEDVIMNKVLKQQFEIHYEKDS